MVDEYERLLRAALKSRDKDTASIVKTILPEVYVFCTCVKGETEYEDRFPCGCGKDHWCYIPRLGRKPGYHWRGEHWRKECIIGELSDA